MSRNSMRTTDYSKRCHGTEINISISKYKIKLLFCIYSFKYSFIDFFGSFRWGTRAMNEVFLLINSTVYIVSLFLLFVLCLFSSVCTVFYFVFVPLSCCFFYYLPLPKCLASVSFSLPTAVFCYARFFFFFSVA